MLVHFHGRDAVLESVTFPSLSAFSPSPSPLPSAKERLVNSWGASYRFLMGRGEREGEDTRKKTAILFFLPPSLPPSAPGWLTHPYTHRKEGRKQLFAFSKGGEEGRFSDKQSQEWCEGLIRTRDFMSLSSSSNFRLQEWENSLNSGKHSIFSLKNYKEIHFSVLSYVVPAVFFFFLFLLLFLSLSDYDKWRGKEKEEEKSWNMMSAAPTPKDPRQKAGLPGFEKLVVCQCNQTVVNKLPQTLKR